MEENTYCEFEPDGIGWTCRLCGWKDRPHPDHPRTVPTLKNCEAKCPAREPLHIDPAVIEHQKYLAQNGCGAQLHWLIKKWTGEDIEPGCGCSSRIAEMNARGPEWCQENVEKIVEWLIEEVDRRLKRAKEEGERAGWRLRVGGIGLPGRRLVLSWFVLLAVWRVEREASLVSKTVPLV